MRWLTTVAISMTFAGGLVGCADGDTAGDVGGAGKSGTAGSGGAGSSGAPGGGSAGKGSAGASNAGATNQAGSAGEGVGGASAGSGGAAAGSGGASAGSGGASAGSGGSMAGSGGAATTAPTAPTGLVLQVQGPTAVKVSWTDNATTELGYRVFWSTTSTKPAAPSLFTEAGITTVTATALTSLTPYTFWVEAYNGAGVSQAITAMATPAPLPAQPTGLVVTSNATQLILNWVDAATDETGYRVFISKTNQQPLVAAHELAAGVQTYTFPAAEIEPYSTHYVWVSAYNASGNSLPATASGAAGEAPAAPSGVAVDTTGIFNITANWTDLSSNETGFNVYWSTDDVQPAVPGATVAAGIQTYKLAKVFGGQTYRFWVEAANGVGKSAAVKGTAATATTDLVWNELWLDTGNAIHLAMADTYNFVGDGDAQTQLYAYQSEVADTMGTAVAINPYVIYNATTQNINLTKVHYFWAEARKTDGTLISLRTLGPAGDVTNLVATPSNLSVGLTWSAVTGAKGYQVYWGTGTFANATLAGSPTAANMTVIGLNPGTAYNFWVRAMGDSIGNAAQVGFPGATATLVSSTTGPSIGTNLALNKAAIASTISGGNTAAMVTDGKYGTRWESAVADPQWVYVDLGAQTATDITHVKAVWEGAYSKSFEIQVCSAACDDNPLIPASLWLWQPAYAADRTLNGFPNFELITLTTPAPAQFVRMLGLTRGTVYGHSLYEFEVYSAPVIQ